MIGRLVFRTLWRSPRRLLIGLVGVALPVGIFAATAFFVDTATRQMTTHALLPVQIDMQVLANSPAVDTAAVGARLARTPRVAAVEPFAAVSLAAVLSSSPTPTDVRVFAVRADYLANHPWVHATSGSLTPGGVLIADPLASAAGQPGSPVKLIIPGQATPVQLTVGGTVDLRKADTWFASTSADNQGEVRFVPAAIVVDYTTFEQQLLPALRAAAANATPTQGTTTPTPGTVSLQEHVTIGRTPFASDPSVALGRSTALRRTLERTAPGQITALDNLGDALGAARGDAINAKVLFLFLGVPGVLVAAGLALATGGALAAAQRREVALLRLRDATTTQISRLTTGVALTVGVVGSAAGLGLAVLAVTALLGGKVWRGASTGSVAVSGALALIVGLAVTALTVRSTTRSARASSVVAQRSQL